MDVRRHTATVRKFCQERGFGFADLPAGIEREPHHQPDLFLHYAEIEGDGYRYLLRGDRISFILRKGPRGYSATAINIISSQRYHPDYEGPR